MASKKTITLDRINRKILNVLQSDNQLTNQELSTQVHVSPATCLRRVRSLRKQGVVKMDVALIDPFQVGRNLVVFVEIDLENIGEDQQDEFEQRINEEAAVMQCYLIAGEFDYLVVVHVADMEEYYEVTRRCFAALKNVKSFRSSFAITRTKFETKIHFDEFGPDLEISVGDKERRRSSVITKRGR